MKTDKKEWTGFNKLLELYFQEIDEIDFKKIIQETMTKIQKPDILATFSRLDYN